MSYIPKNDLYIVYLNDQAAGGFHDWETAKIFRNKLVIKDNIDPNSVHLVSFEIHRFDPNIGPYAQITDLTGLPGPNDTVEVPEVQETPRFRSINGIFRVK